MTAEPDAVVHDAQITPAHVFELVRDQVVPRLDTLEGRVDALADTVKQSGLNGHTPYLKAFLEQYASTYQTRQAWLTVRSDLAYRLSFLKPTKKWLALVVSALIGAVVWRLVTDGIPPL